MAVNNAEVKMDLMNFNRSYIEGQELKLGSTILSVTRSARDGCTICLIPTVIRLRIRTPCDTVPQEWTNNSFPTAMLSAAYWTPKDHYCARAASHADLEKGEGRPTRAKCTAAEEDRGNGLESMIADKGRRRGKAVS